MLVLSVLQTILIHFIIYRLNFSKTSFFGFVGCTLLLLQKWAAGSGMLPKNAVAMVEYGVKGTVVVGATWAIGSWVFFCLIPLLCDVELSALLSKAFPKLNVFPNKKRKQSGSGGKSSYSMENIWSWNWRNFEHVGWEVFYATYVSSMLPLMFVPSSDLYYPRSVAFVLVFTFFMNALIIHIAAFLNEYQVQMRNALRLQGCWKLVGNAGDPGAPKGEQEPAAWKNSVVFGKGERVIYQDKVYLAEYNETFATPGSLSNIFAHVIFSDAAWTRYVLVCTQGVLVAYTSISIYISPFWVFYGIGLFGCLVAFDFVTRATAPAELIEGSADESS
jgi:hypothetical protein